MNEADLIIKNKNNQARLSQSCVQRSSFYLQWEKNATYQIQFTAFDDRSVAYDLLVPRASLMFQGQEFIINQIEPDYAAGVKTKAVVATHIYAECQWFRKRDVKNGTLTYTPKDIMDFIFADNNQGFTYKIFGKFESKQIENLGNISGKDALAKIVEVWPDAIIFPDNKQINIYDHDSFVKSHGHRVGYLNNASEIKLNYDATTITNQVWCIGKAKDKKDGADDNAPTEYFFPPFLVKDDESIKKWTNGVPHEREVISDERFTDHDAMEKYARSQLLPTPALSVEVTTNFNSQPIAGDLVRLEIREDEIVDDIEIVAYQWYPWDLSQNTQLTLNNLTKTIFDYQNSLRSKYFKDLKSNFELIIAANQNSTNGKDDNHSDDKNWKAGSIFIDTSSNNGDMSVNDFNALKQQGVKGIICKTTESDDYINPNFNQHVTNAEKAGIKFIGAYHFFRGNAVAEANYFLKQLEVNKVAKDKLVICDIEGKDLTSDKQALTKQIKEFYEVLNNAGYKNTCDYASASWFNTRFSQVGKYNWIASYGAVTAPNNANAWQFTENFNNKKIDASYSFNQAFI